MLIIGHRGASGLAPENSLEAFEAGQKADADILEFDVRLTKDKIPVVIHDRHVNHADTSKTVISRTTLAGLKAKGHNPEIITLETLLDQFFGKIMLNIELKSFGSGRVVMDLLAERYIQQPDDWDAVIISSFSWNELIAARRMSKRANLGLLQSTNPFAFLVLHRQLELTAIGFHRLHVNRFALAIAKRARIFTFAYTVNRADTAEKLAERGLDGIVTDYPDRIAKLFSDIE